MPLIYLQYAHYLAAVTTMLL